MPAFLAKEIWSELKRHISSVDREEAAETLVGVMIDNDIDADEIKSIFKSDAEVKRALAAYIKDHHEEEDDDDDYDVYDDDGGDEWD